MSENNNVKRYLSTVIDLGLFVIKNHSSGEALTKHTSRNAAPPSMMGWHDVRSQKATAGDQSRQLARHDMNMTHSSGEAFTKDTSPNAAPSMMGWHDVRSQKATAGEGVIQTVSTKVININHSSGEALTKDTSPNAAPSMMGWYDVRSQKATAGEGVIQTVGAAVTLSFHLSVCHSSKLLFLLCLVSIICTFSLICRMFS